MNEYNEYALSQKTRVTLYGKTVKEDSIIYTFIRNLGHADLKRAKRDFPQAEVNLKLRGRQVIVSINKPSDKGMLFSFGPYFQQPISECTNDHYLTNCLAMHYVHDEEYDAYKKRALELGCVCLGEDSWWAKSDIGKPMYNRAVEMYKKNNGLKPLLLTGKEFTIDIDTNVSLDGKYTNSNKYGDLVFEFPYVHYEANSHAPEHSYIMDIKTGKGKKTKGKQVVIKKYKVRNNNIKCIEYDVIK